MRSSECVNSDGCEFTDACRGRRSRLLAELLKCSEPVLNVIGRRKLVAVHCEHIDRHGLKAPPGGLRSEQLALRCPACFPPNYDLVPRHKDVLDRPAQIRDCGTDHLEDLG